MLKFHGVSISSVDKASIFRDLLRQISCPFFPIMIERDIILFFCIWICGFYHNCHIMMRGIFHSLWTIIVGSFGFFPLAINDQNYSKKLYFKVMVEKLNLNLWFL